LDNLPSTPKFLHKSFNDTGNILNESLQNILLDRDICINLFLSSIIADTFSGLV